MNILIVYIKTRETIVDLLNNCWVLPSMSLETVKNIGTGLSVIYRFRYENWNVSFYEGKNSFYFRKESQASSELLCKNCCCRTLEEEIT